MKDIKREFEINRIFIDALRNYLGMDNLYEENRNTYLDSKASKRRVTLTGSIRIFDDSGDGRTPRRHSGYNAGRTRRR